MSMFNEQINECIPPYIDDEDVEGDGLKDKGHGRVSLEQSFEGKEDHERAKRNQEGQIEQPGGKNGQVRHSTHNLSQ